MKRRGAPEQQAYPLPVLLGHLVETVTRWEAGTQKMFSFQERVKVLALGEISEHAHGQQAVDVRRGGGSSWFHPNLLCP
jgi:hypothetical protein